MTLLIEPIVSQPATSVGELLKRLGGISPDRIRLQPALGTATERDVEAIKNRENRTCELIDGVIVEKDMGLHEAVIAGAILAALRAFVVPRKLGFVTGPDGMLRLFPGLIRAPDVAFLDSSRFPGGVLPAPAIPDLVPDLAIEVLSESNTTAEMERKRSEYFTSGVRLMWVVDRRTRSATVYAPDREPRVLHDSQSLDGEGVLPGFSLPLSEVFAATTL